MFYGGLSCALNPFLSPQDRQACSFIGTAGMTLATGTYTIGEFTDYYGSYAKSCVRAGNNRGTPTWPNDPEEMDKFLGMKGQRIPDTANTVGRNKVVWQPSNNIRITYEQHPYHPDAPYWHQGPHWHLDTPGAPHQRFLPGHPIPGYD